MRPLKGMQFGAATRYRGRMTASQRRQLQNVEEMVGAMVAELEPRVISPSAEKQQALGLAEETMLFSVGPSRAITVCASEDGGWSIKEFETSTGDLVPVWDETGELPDTMVASVVLGATIASLEEQLAATGDTAVANDLRAPLTTLLFILRQRHITLTEHGIEHFDLEHSA
jgi:hypothetical protein